MTANLATSLTFALPNSIKTPDKPLIDENTFSNPAEHFVVQDPELSHQLNELAMQEMAITKVAVGSRASFEPVEFFWIDVKKDKKVIEKLKRIISHHWIKLIYELEAARDDVGNILAPELTPLASTIERWIKLRRFLVEGTDPETLKKKRRSILLFHHTQANAPVPD